MNELFRKVVTGPPLQDLANEQVGVAQYIILCAQAPDPQGRLKLLQSRLRTSTETSSAQNVMHLLSTCLSTTISPDDVEEMVEMVTELALQHPNWPEFIKWVCALVHYYCTDDFTLSLFSEYQVPEVAVRALKDFPQNQQLVLAATALLAHFNMYDIGDGITQLTNALLLHFTDYPTCRISTNALAEFTSYCREIPDRYTQACWEFVAASGVSAIGGILREYTSNEEITTHAARIAANVSSSVTNAISPDSDVMMHFAESLETFPESTELCSYVMRVFSNVPQSPHINWNCIAALFKNTKSESVALECIHFLSSVAINLKELKPQIHATGCVPRVLETMREYPQNAAIQEQACSLLSYLSFDSEAITASITELGGLELVLNAMKHFPDNEDLLMSSCAALSGLTFNNIRGQQVIVDHEGVALIIDAMRKGRKARLQENGCLVMGTMCWNADLKADVVRLGGVKVIMKALEEHYTCSGLVKNACRALAQVAFNCDRYRDEMSADGVIPLIIRGMEQHPNYDRAQMHGCVALSYLSWTNEGNAAQITAHRGYKVVVDAMRNHPINHEVQEHACRALANISNVSLEDSAAALEQMVAAMRRHERVSEVQEEACRAIVTLSLVSPINKNRLFELNGAAAVIMAMQNFPDTQLVQQEACNALAHLAYEHAQLNRAVTDLNGVELLLTAMKTHRSSPKVQLNACGGLSALAFDNTIAQQQIFELGGVQCVIYAMDHFERLRMLELGCSVLGTLAWNTEIKERVAIDAIPEILKAMRIHENSPLLQKSTCRAISQFAFNSENNRHLLAEAGAIPLIVNAMRMHLGTEKLVVHALKALTYLCWENTEVAETIIAERVEEVLQHIVEHYALTQRVFNEAIHLSKILFRKTNGSPSPNLRIMSPPNVSPMSMNYMYTPAPRRDREESNPPPTPHPRDDYLSLRGTPSVDGDLFMDEPWQTSCTRGRGRGRGRGNGQGRGGPHRGRGGTGPHHSRDGPSHHDPSAGEERFGPPPPTRSRGGRGRGRAGAGGQDSATPWDDPNPENFHGRRNNRGMNWQQAEMVSRDAVDEGAGGRWRVGSRGNRDGGGGRPSGGAGGDDSRE